MEFNYVDNELDIQFGSSKLKTGLCVYENCENELVLFPDQLTKLEKCTDNSGNVFFILSKSEKPLYLQNKKALAHAHADCSSEQGE